MNLYFGRRTNKTPLYTPYNRSGILRLLLHGKKFFSAVVIIIPGKEGFINDYRAAFAAFIAHFKEQPVYLALDAGDLALKFGGGQPKHAGTQRRQPY